MGMGKSMNRLRQLAWCIGFPLRVFITIILFVLVYPLTPEPGLVEAVKDFWKPPK